MVPINVTFERLGRRQGPLPVVDVRLEPEPTFTKSGKYLDPRIRRVRYFSRGNTILPSEPDPVVELSLKANSEVSDEPSIYVFTIHVGSRRRVHRVLVPTEAEAAEYPGEVTYPIPLSTLVAYTEWRLTVAESG